MSPTDQLVPLLKKLRLSGLLESLEVRTQQAVDDNLAHTEFLLRVLTDEIERRDSKMLDQRIRRANFEHAKTLEDFDFLFNPSIPKAQVIDLATCLFVRQKRNVLLVGPSGVGKSHIAQALGHRACLAGYKTIYTVASDMFKQLRAARGDGSYERRLRRFVEPDLLEEPNSLTPEQTRRFLEKAKVLYPQHYAMILTMVTTSIRISAARALRWEDISWTRQMITVCRRLSGEEELRGVKEGADIKIVPMTSALISTLQEHRKRLNPQQLKSGLVFPSEPGGHRSRSVLNTPFKKILKAAGIKQRFTPHGSRRTANNLVRQVASKLITKSITGHCTDRMHELYSTVMDKEKREAAKLAFDELAPIPDSVGDPVGDLSSEYNLDID